MQNSKRFIIIGTPFVLCIAIILVVILIFSKQKELTSKPYLPNDVPVIAVLPFVNIGNDSSQQYWSDGFSGEMLRSIHNLKGVRVIDLTASPKFKGNDINIKNIGERLDVSAVLKGSLLPQEDSIKISVELVSVVTARQIWSAQYKEKKVDIFELQNKIADTIAEKLGIKYLNKHRPKIFNDIVPNKEAIGLYLQGRSSWNLKTSAELIKGIEFFKHCVAIAPSYAAAYAGIADSYTALGYGSFMAPKEAFPKAYEAATKALELDSTLAEPHASLGYYQFYYKWNWAAAEQEFLIAIALNPNFELGYNWYGYYLTAMKRYDEARFIFKKAVSLAPLSPTISTDMGFSFYYSGNYQLATEELQASLQLNPKFGLTHFWLGRTYQAKKMFSQAIVEYKKALTISQNWPVALAAMGHAYGEWGKKKSALKIIDTLASLSTRRFVTSYGVALVYCSLEQKDQAFRWLNKAYDERSNWLVWLTSDPRLATLRSDRRYTDLVDRVGLNINDSIALAEFSKKLSIYKAALDNEKKQAQIDLLANEKVISQQQLLLSKQQVKNESFQKYILIAGVLALILLGFIIFRNVSLRQKNEVHRHKIIEHEFKLRQLENDRDKNKLQQKATALEIQAIQAQMNPHFIFNCLNSINHFILVNERKTAADYLTKFAKLVRIILQQSGKTFIPLEDELYCLRLYMSLEAIRFKIPFLYQINSHDIDTSSLMIPPLLLQPFVENAIWYGLHPMKNGQGSIIINLTLTKDFINCSISDNGVGRSKVSIPKENTGFEKKSLGIQLTSNRLQLIDSLLKNGEPAIVIKDLINDTGESEGTCVHIKIPVKLT